MTTPVTTTFEALKATNNPNLMFKALGGIIFSAKMSVAVPTAFTNASTADLIQLNPTDWSALGLIPKGDGITFSRDISSDDTESWGYSQPTRTDITGDATSAKFTLQQTSRAALELYDFVDLSAVTADTTTGEYAYNKPTVTAPVYRRLIYMAVDGVGNDRRYRWKIMPRAQVVAVDDEVWSQAAVTSYPMTINATEDPVLGYAVRNVFGGPGQKSRNVAAGFASS